MLTDNLNESALFIRPIRAIVTTLVINRFWYKNHLNMLYHFLYIMFIIHQITSRIQIKIYIAISEKLNVIFIKQWNLSLVLVNTNIILWAALLS